MWVLNERQPQFGSTTNETVETTAGIYKTEPPKRYRYKEKSASSKYGVRQT
jgi:hypothetical protein